MDIIHVPNPHLRKKSVEVTEVTPELLRFIEQIQKTLDEKRNPRGVGLSSPQVHEDFAVFVTLLESDDEEHSKPLMRTFINPLVLEVSPAKTFGKDLKEPILEGCLSIPHLYGPVPRFEWVKYQFQEIVDGQLVTKSERFKDFSARVMQHEYDHLQGILFTDYILEFDLPLYDDNSGKLVEIDRKIAGKF